MCFLLDIGVSERVVGALLWLNIKNLARPVTMPNSWKKLVEEASEEDNVNYNLNALKYKMLKYEHDCAKWYVYVINIQLGVVNTASVRQTWVHKFCGMPVNCSLVDVRNALNSELMLVSSLN